MKVLIADDEPDVRMGLKTIIDWHSLGFEICGEAANGEECLEKIFCFNPELVMLDIRMPKMHGLKCAKDAREKGWNGKIIILSGYSDFQFAQGAIECGVETYLLKPIDEDELKNAVEKIRKKIEEERKESRKINFVLEKGRNIFLLDILNGKISSDDSNANVTDYGLTADRYLIVIPEKQNANSLKYQEITNLLQSKPVERIKYDAVEVFLLVGSDTIRKFEEIIGSGKLNGIFLAVGRTVSSMEEISLSFQDAMTVFSRRFFTDRNQTIVRVENLPRDLNICKISEMHIHDYVEKLYAYIQSCNYRSVEILLDGLYQKLIAMEVLPDYTVNILINMTILVKNSILHDYEKENITFENDAEIIAVFGSKKRLYEIIDSMKEGFGKLTEAISNLKSNNIVNRMRIYIDRNYGKNLKLEYLAQSFGYNSAYLGKIFKNNVGESFNSYLDRIRIEKAKEMLAQQDFRVYEISHSVGYENIDYFYIKFHKYVGISPLEYRKTVCPTNNKI